MSIKVASRERWDIDGIVNEIRQPDIKAVIYFFSPAFEQHEPQGAFKKAFPEAACICASMIGGWSPERALETGITAMSLSSDEVAEVYTAFQEGVKQDAAKTAQAAIEELKQKTQGKQINPDEYLGLIFFDGMCLGELIMKEFTKEKSLNMAFVGGSAADDLKFTKTLVGIDNRLSGDGLAVMILKMKIPFFFNHYVHYVPTEKSFTVTKSDNQTRTIWEIDGEPAALFYAKQIGTEVSRLDAGVFSKNPLGVINKDNVYVRSPRTVVEGNGLQFYCYIETGSRVHLLKQGDIIANAEKGLSDAGTFLPGIQGGILCNCVLRYLELKETNKLNAFNNVFSKYSFIGFNTYGEELFTHHNQTLTAVFFGAPIAPGAVDPYKTKRHLHFESSRVKSQLFEMDQRMLKFSSR
jgi:hypothetical protein